MKQKQAWYGQLDSVQKKIVEEVIRPNHSLVLILQQEALAKLRGENNADDIARQIEQLIKQKQSIDTQIVHTAEVMKGMNLQANSRAKLNIKKTEKKKREDENEQL